MANRASGSFRLAGTLGIPPTCSLKIQTIAIPAKASCRATSLAFVENLLKISLHLPRLTHKPHWLTGLEPANGERYCSFHATQRSLSPAPPPVSPSLGPLSGLSGSGHRRCLSGFLGFEGFSPAGFFLGAFFFAGVMTTVSSSNLLPPMLQSLRLICKQETAGDNKIAPDPTPGFDACAWTISPKR